MDTNNPSEIAAALGRLAKGVPKTLTLEERQRRGERMRKVATEYNAKLAAGLVTRRLRGTAKKKPV